MQFNTREEEGLLAAIPPLEALGLLMSEAATVKGGRKEVGEGDDGQLCGASLFRGPMKWNVCVEIPTDVRSVDDDDEDNVAWSKMSLCGNRDAKANFQTEVGRLMEFGGFMQGKHNPRTFHHSPR